MNRATSNRLVIGAGLGLSGASHGIFEILGGAPTGG
jgi:hypothetical protein